MDAQIESSVGVRVTYEVDKQTPIIEKNVRESADLALDEAQEVLDEAQDIAQQALETAQSFVKDGVDYFNAKFTAQLEEAIKKAVDKTQEESSDQILARLLPSGAVVAFDLPNGCPTGWAKFDAASERFIIGVGGKYQLPYVDGDPQYQLGGEEPVALTVAQTPARSHSPSFVPESSELPGVGDPVKSDPSDAGNAQENARSNEVRRVLRHNNMPPYIALYFCKKL